jgi:hypothetical protein
VSRPLDPGVDEDCQRVGVEGVDRARLAPEVPGEREVVTGEREVALGEQDAWVAGCTLGGAVEHRLRLVVERHVTARRHQLDVGRAQRLESLDVVGGPARRRLELLDPLLG